MILTVGVLVLAGGVDPALGLTGVLHEEEEFTTPDAAAFAPDRLIVRFEPLEQGQDARARAALPEVTNLRRLIPDSARRRSNPNQDGPHQIYIADLSPGAEVRTLARRITAMPGVRYAEPDYIVHADDTFPNDPDFAELWGLHNTGQTGGVPDADIDAPEAWDITTGSPDVIVGVIDTGVDFSHPDLADNMWVNPGESGNGYENDGIDNDGNGYVDDVYGYDFLLDDPDPSDAKDHGTHVAGTIAAIGDNGIGVVGVTWTARIMALRFLSAAGGGWTSDAVEALYYAIDNGARVTNNSWGGGGYSQTLYDALVAARDAGVLFVAAAGNSADDNDEAPHYPSSYDVESVLAVASTDHDDELSGFSNWGLTSVDLGAPGSSIYSTIPPFVTLFSEDFQGVTPPDIGDQFTLEGPANYWGTIDRGDGNIAARGDAQQSSPYRPDADGWIVSPPFDTTGLRGLSLYFEYRYEMEKDDDALIVEVWDGTDWREVLRRSSDCCFRDYYYATRIDLEPYRNPAMQLRFGWQTDGDDNDYYGGEIDSVSIRYIGSDYTGDTAYDVKSGTSMATPHVAGAAALLLADTSDMCLPELKGRLMLAGDALAVLEGITAFGRRLNAYSALTASSDVTVIVPNGGETWLLGSTYMIGWSAFDCDGLDPVDILLLKGGAVHTQLADGVPNTGAFFWSIPLDLPTGSDYRIRIDDGTNMDESDADFTLRPPLVVYVDIDAPGGGNGMSWETAFDDLQEALDAAIPGDSIWTAEGIYRPSDETEPGDPRSATFQLRNDVAIYGGFAGWESELDERDPVANVTLLSGDLDDDDYSGGDDSENSYHVVTGSGCDETAVLDGFVITGGNANGSPLSPWGGGMAMVGGGSPSVSNCVFSGNRAYSGGAIVNNTGSPRLTHCVFVGNSANYSGGVMYNTLSSSPALLGCVLSGNSAFRGGAIGEIAFTAPSLASCIVSGNLATDAGGGMWNYNGSVPSVVNSTFSGNSAPTGGAIYNQDSAYQTVATVSNCILWNDSPDEIYVENNDSVFTYSDIQGGWPGEGNLDADPLFVGGPGGVWTADATYDPARAQTTLADANASWSDDELAGMFLNPDTTQPLQSVIVNNTTTTITVWGDFAALGLAGSVYQINDYHLASDSPCIDAGDPDFVPEEGETDMDGEPRVTDGDSDGVAIVDMGADEHHDCNGNGITDSRDIAEGTSLDCNANGIPDECEYVPGSGCPGNILPADMNCDGAVNGADIQRFADTLVAGGYTCQADMDQNGVLDMADVPDFAGALLGLP